MPSSRPRRFRRNRRRTSRIELGTGVIDMRYENPLYMAEEDSWAQADARDQVGYLDGGLDRFGRSYAGEPEPSCRSSPGRPPWPVGGQ